MSGSRTRMPRRSFLRSAGFGAAAGAAFGGAPAVALAQGTSGAAAPFEPARHAEDDWFDQIPGKHRLFLDATTAKGAGEAILYASNFLSVNKNTYGLDAGELALIISMRHDATAFAYTDEMWAKYGKALSGRAGDFVDPKTKEPPALNVYMASGYGAQLASLGVTFDSVLKQGVRVAVCQLATRANAQAIARQTGGTANDINAELVAHLVPGARMVPAGIVAASRAQERHYTIVFTG